MPFRVAGAKLSFNYTFVYPLYSLFSPQAKPMPIKIMNYFLTVDAIVMLKVSIAFLTVASSLGHSWRTGQACFVHCFSST